MKFDCGETEEEKIKRLEEWHKYFALFPRRVADHDCRWLEYIERRLIVVSRSWEELDYIWEYRAIN